MRKTKRVIAALTAAIITATSTSLMSVCADENGGSDFGFVSKSTTNKSDNIEAVESDAQLYDKLGQLLKDGDSLKYGEALYTTGTPDGEKWTKEFYEQRVEFYGEDLLSKYIVDGEFLRKNVESDMNGLLKKTANELDKYVDIINEYLMSNSIAGSAYAIKNDGIDKLLITYDGHLKKIKEYIAEIGIDESLVIYEQPHDDIVVIPATTIAVTGTNTVTTITMPVVDDPSLITSVATVKIIDVSGDTITVKPIEGSWELKSADKFTLSAKQLPADITPKTGMKLEITYNGGILETYPAMFGNIQKITVATETDTDKEGATWLKGTKDMTLKDVIELAKKGNDLDWSDFKDYNGRDVGSGLHIWEYKLEDGYVLDVGGDIQKKPIYILLSRNNEKGIDIRTEDVKEYIASTATPVSENSENSTLKATAESVSKFMSENGISGYAYVGKADGVEKIYIPYAGDLEKLKTYVAEKGIDESLVVYQLSDWNNYGSGQSSGNKEVQKPLISEDDILDLSKKGDELTWSDFEKYEFTDIGDGTNIWQFVIKNSGSKLLVIGRNLKEKPEHINFVWGNGAEFDIRTEDLTPWFYDDALVVKGDANCDGQVDLSDAVMIMQALANPNKYGIDGTAEHHLTEQGKLNGDMNGDGLTVGDAQAIQRKLLGLDESDSNQNIDNSEYLFANEPSGSVMKPQRLALNCNSFCANGETLKIQMLMGDKYTYNQEHNSYPNFDSEGNPEYSIFATENFKKIDDERLVVNGAKSEYTKTFTKEDMNSLDITGKEGDYTAYYNDTAEIDFSNYSSGSTGCISVSFGWKADGVNPYNPSSDFDGTSQTIYFYVGENGTGISNNGWEAAQIAYEAESDNDIMFYDSLYLKWNGKEVMSNLYEELRKPNDEVLPIIFKLSSSPNGNFEYKGKTLEEYGKERLSQNYLKYEQLLIYGDYLKYGEDIYKTGAPDGTKWVKEFYEETIDDIGEELISKYIVGGEFLKDKLEADIVELKKKANDAYNEAEKAYLKSISDKAIKQLNEQNIKYEYKADPKRLVIYATAEEFKSLNIDNVLRYWLDTTH